MTADERYARCESIEELERLYDLEKRGADSWAYLKAIEDAFGKHYRRLSERRKQDGCTGR